MIRVYEHFFIRTPTNLSCMLLGRLVPPLFLQWPTSEAAFASGELSGHTRSLTGQLVSHSVVLLSVVPLSVVPPSVVPQWPPALWSPSLRPPSLWSPSVVPFSVAPVL